MYGRVTEKIDVYAFGVVLLELLSSTKPINNECPKAQQSLVMWAGYAILAIGVEWIFHPVKGLILPVLCSCDVLLLLLTGIFQQYLVYQVPTIRLQGYYSFSQKLKFVIQIPFAIIAYGTAAMLLVIVRRENHHHHQQLLCCHHQCLVA